jgi:hypothetical protein
LIKVKAEFEEMSKGASALLDTEKNKVAQLSRDIVKLREEIESMLDGHNALKEALEEESNTVSHHGLVFSMQLD